ncbi:MAG: hypothetical protein ACK4TL_16740 [Hyphomicrobiaceae bacterium]
MKYIELAIQIAIAVGTVGAVIVALFGDRLRSRPHLIVQLRDAKGYRIDRSFVRFPDEYVSPSLWFHLKVSNARRSYTTAHETQLYLLSVQVPDAAGAFVPEWSGAIPLQVRDRAAVLSGATLGPDIEFDLFSVTKNAEMNGAPFLELHPVIRPNNLKAATHGPYKSLLTFQARSIEADSEPLNVSIVWDGEWSDDPERMARHLVVEMRAGCDKIV